MTLSVRRSTGGSGDVGPIKADILMKILINKVIRGIEVMQEIEGLTSNMDEMWA